MATKKNKPAASTYDWGDGKGRVHTIPKGVHKQNVEARGYGINLDAPTSAPLSNRQAYGLAQQGADLEYNPQIEATKSMQRSVPEWYASTMATIAAQGAAQQAQANPLLQQAQAGVTNAGTMTAPGLDPSSPQYAVEQQAAKGRQSIAQSGYDALAAIPTATQGYLGGQVSSAARELPQVQAQYGQQLGQLQGQRGAAVAKNYGDLRGQEQNSQIAYSTLGLNQQKASADVDLARGVDPVTGKDLPQDAPTGYGSGGPGQNKYGYTYDEWSSLTPAQQAKERKGTDNTAKKEAEKAAKDKAKKQATIQTATGKVRNKVTDIIGAWDRGGSIDVTDKDGKVTGSRKATPQELRSAIVDKYGYLGRIALAIREGRPLDKKAQDYLHNLDPDFRIPREWIKSKPVAARPPTADDGSGQQRPT